VLASLTVACDRAAAAEYTEDDVKAAFVARFASYVEWPASNTDAPMVIGVVGADGTLEKVRELSADMRVDQRRVIVEGFHSATDLKRADVLFVSSEAIRRESALARAALREPAPTLVVTDRSQGIPAGAVINFVVQERKVRFEISLVEAERRQLKLKAGLLSVAIRIDGKPRADLHCGDAPLSCSDWPWNEERLWFYARAIFTRIRLKAPA